MKLPNRYSIGIALTFSFCVAVVVGRWAWKQAHRGGFPFFSLATLQAIWPWIVLLAVCLVGVALGDRDSK